MAGANPDNAVVYRCGHGEARTRCGHGEARTRCGQVSIAELSLTGLLGEEPIEDVEVVRLVLSSIAA